MFEDAGVCISGVDDSYNSVYPTFLVVQHIHTNVLSIPEETSLVQLNSAAVVGLKNGGKKVKKYLWNSHC